MGLFTPWYRDSRYNSDGINAKESATPNPVQNSSKKSSAFKERLAKMWRGADKFVSRWNKKLGYAFLIAAGIYFATSSDWDTLRDLFEGATQPADPVVPKPEVPVPEAPVPETGAHEPATVPQENTTTQQPEEPAPHAEPEEPTLEEKDAARRAELIEDQTYETARLNVEQYADTTLNVEPTQETLDAFRTALAERLGVPPGSLTDDMLREVLSEKGGYTDPQTGVSYEIWQKRGGTEFYFIDNPYEHYPDLGPDPDTLIPPTEVSDIERKNILIDTAVLHDPYMHELTGPNEFDPGSPEYEAWERMQAFLRTHETWLGEMWKDPDGTIRASEYFGRAGIT